MSTHAQPKHTNRLAHETSPYLLQHAHNPVDWYPWGAEALERARREDRPILLSIGYSACHWCHVMETESFEDEETAALMNRHFVCIKVDREERPDLDEVYMSAVQLMTRHGGWPMTVFLTPDKLPFFGGTYFPPDDRHGLPSFRRVLESLARAYAEQRHDVAENAKAIAAEVRRMGQVRAPAGGAPAPAAAAALLTRAERALAAGHDSRYGGFGGAPKFPSTMALSLCLRRWRASGDAALLRLVTVSLERMAAGGIHDHVGGGFHRYSVDERWLVPHFEKMLYDNALLARLYVEAWQATGEPAFRATAEGILGYVRRDLARPGGGYYATRDADSEGVEGKYYVWTPGEVRAVLGAEEGALFCRVYDVTEAGNFEHGASIPNQPRTIAEQARDLKLDVDELERRLGQARARLLKARNGRVPPARDEKVIVGWNGLMLAAMAFAARALGAEAERRSALETGEFLWRELVQDGRLRHTFKDGQAKLDAYLDDVAGLGVAFVELFQTTLDPTWLTRACALAETMQLEFADAEGGGFFYTSTRGEALIARSKNPFDNATPGGNSLAAHLLLALHALTGDGRYEEAAGRTLAALADLAAKSPHGLAHLLEALETQRAGIVQVVVAGDPARAETEALLAAAAAGYVPNRVVALADPAAAPAAELAQLLAGKTPLAGRPAAYVCRRFACERPVKTPDALRAALLAMVPGA